MTYRTLVKSVKSTFSIQQCPHFSMAKSGKIPKKTQPLLVQRRTHESRGSSGRTERQKWLCHLGRKRPGPCCGNGLDLTYVCINPCISIDSYIYILSFLCLICFHLFIYLSIYFFIYLSIYSFMYLFICLFEIYLLKINIYDETINIYQQ